MNFEPDNDLATFLTAVERLTAGYKGAWRPEDTRYQYSRELESELEASGFFGCVQEEGLGLLAATAMVLELSKLPVCVELSASSLVAPLVCPQLPRPLAVIWGDARRPTRFLPVARSVLLVGAEGVSAAVVRDGDVELVDSLFAYPMGVLKNPRALTWEPIEADKTTRMADLWRLGVAAEIVGSLLSGLDAVVAHVTERRQFGRPLGSFQGIQHRLAATASALQGARWLTLQAAHTGSALDAATAAGVAQGLSTKVAYDLHQFMGAMGLTLEHPLHRWTYRTKLLRSELGGTESQFQRVAELAWE